MAKSARKGKQKAVSYAEVDSDVDMQEEDRQVERCKAKRAIEKARKLQADDARRSSKLGNFLLMPVDVVAEICSFLGTGDLYRLALSCKTCHKMLLNPANRSIWSLARRQAKLPSLPLNEVNYALLIYGRCCLICDVTNPSVIGDFILQNRTCSACREELLISVSELHEYEMHEQATSCVWSTALSYPLEELVEVNETLFELQEEDELAEHLSSGYQLSTRSRQRPTADLQSKVDDYVNQRRKIVSKRRELAAKISQQLAKNKEEDRLRRLVWNTELKNALKLDLELSGWPPADVVYYLDHIYWPAIWTEPNSVARSSALYRSDLPSDAPEPWTVIKNKVKRLREDAERDEQELRDRLALASRQAPRIERLYPFYDSLLDWQPHKALYPRFEAWQKLPSVRPFWEPDAGLDPFNKDVWGDVLEVIEWDVEEYQEEIRMTATRLILDANTDLRLPTSDDPIDYGAYDNDFFSRATSSFFSCSDGFKCFPECLDFHSTFNGRQFRYREGELDLSLFIHKLNVHVMLAILDCANLPRSATLKDVEKLGQTLSWPAHPAKSKRRILFSPEQLMGEVLRRVVKTKKKTPPHFTFRCSKPCKAKPTTDLGEVTIVDEEDAEGERDGSQAHTSSAELEVSKVIEGGR